MRLVQLLIALIAGFLGVAAILRAAFAESWKLGVACLLLPPFLLYYVSTRWSKCQSGSCVLAVCLSCIALLQCVRLAD